jgi:hypothetical protein
MNVDTAEFAAIRAQLDRHERRIASFSFVFTTLAERQHIPVPDDRPELTLVGGSARRRTKPRGRLRGIDGGAA